MGDQWSRILDDLGPEREAARREVRRAAIRHGLNPDLLEAQAMQESSFNPKAGSPAGAMGVAQFIESTGRMYGLSSQDRFDVPKASDAMARHMKDLLNKYNGNVDAALAAYNGGPKHGNIVARGGVSPSEENRNYQPSIKKYYDKITGGGSERDPFRDPNVRPRRAVPVDDDGVGGLSLPATAAAPPPAPKRELPADTGWRGGFNAATDVSAQNERAAAPTGQTASSILGDTPLPGGYDIATTFPKARPARVRIPTAATPRRVENPLDYFSRIWREAPMNRSHDDVYEHRARDEAAQRSSRAVAGSRMAGIFAPKGNVRPKFDVGRIAGSDLVGTPADGLYGAVTARENKMRETVAANAPSPQPLAPRSHLGVASADWVDPASVYGEPVEFVRPEGRPMVGPGAIFQNPDAGFQAPTAAPRQDPRAMRADFGESGPVPAQAPKPGFGAGVTPEEQQRAEANIRNPRLAPTGYFGKEQAQREHDKRGWSGVQEILARPTAFAPASAEFWGDALDLAREFTWRPPELDQETRARQGEVLNTQFDQSWTGLVGRLGGIAVNPEAALGVFATDDAVSRLKANSEFEPMMDRLGAGENIARGLINAPGQLAQGLSNNMIRSRQRIEADPNAPMPGAVDTIGHLANATGQAPNAVGALMLGGAAAPALGGGEGLAGLLGLGGLEAVSGRPYGSPDYPETPDEYLGRVARASTTGYVFPYAAKGLAPIVNPLVRGGEAAIGRLGPIGRALEPLAIPSRLGSGAAMAATGPITAGIFGDPMPDTGQTLESVVTGIATGPEGNRFQGVHPSMHPTHWVAQARDAVQANRRALAVSRLNPESKITYTDDAGARHIGTIQESTGGLNPIVTIRSNDGRTERLALPDLVRRQVEPGANHDVVAAGMLATAREATRLTAQEIAPDIKPGAALLPRPDGAPMEVTVEGYHSTDPTGRQYVRLTGWDQPVPLDMLRHPDGRQYGEPAPDPTAVTPVEPPVARTAADREAIVAADPVPTDAEPTPAPRPPELVAPTREAGDARTYLVRSDDGRHAMVTVNGDRVVRADEVTNPKRSAKYASDPAINVSADEMNGLVVPDQFADGAEGARTQFVRDYNLARPLRGGAQEGSSPATEASSSTRSPLEATAPAEVPQPIVRRTLNPESVRLGTESGNLVPFGTDGRYVSDSPEVQARRPTGFRIIDTRTNEAMNFASRAEAEAFAAGPPAEPARRPIAPEKIAAAVESGRLVPFEGSRYLSDPPDMVSTKPGHRIVDPQSNEVLAFASREDAAAFVSRETSTPVGGVDAAPPTVRPGEEAAPPPTGAVVNPDGTITRTVADQRKDPKTRTMVTALYSDAELRAMTHDELIEVVKRVQIEQRMHELTGIKNKIAYMEAKKKKVQTSIDLAGLKIANDTVNPEFGDSILTTAAQLLLKHAGEDAFHVKGDEFIAQFDSKKEAEATMKAFRKELFEAIHRYTMPNGKVRRFTGVDLYYEHGKTIVEADFKLNENKKQRKLDETGRTVAKLVELTPERGEVRNNPAGRPPLPGGEDGAGSGADGSAGGTGRNNVEPREGAGPVLRGRSGEIRIPGTNERVPFTYVIRDAADVHASHTGLGVESGTYEYENDRRYDKPEDRARIERQARLYDTEQAHTDNPTPEVGPAIIDPRGNVLGGNSREMTTKLVYAQYPENAAALQRSLAERAESFGIPADQIASMDSMERPQLYREIDADYFETADPQKLIRDFNAPSTAKLTEGERAMSLARNVSPEALALISTKIGKHGEDGSVAQALSSDGPEIINKLIADGLITNQERPELFGEDGSINEKGRSLVRDILIGKMFRDGDQLSITSPSLKGKLERISSRYQRVENDPALADWRIGDTLHEAIDLLNDARARGTNRLDLVYAQTSLLEAPRFSEDAIALAKVLQMGPKNAADQINGYYKEALRSLPDTPGDLFGMFPATPKDAAAEFLRDSKKGEPPPETPEGDAPLAMAEDLEAPKHKFGSTQINAPETIARKIRSIADAIPDDALAGDGRETNPHITVLYGLQTPEDVTKIRELAAKVEPFYVTVGETSVFRPSENSDGASVLKVDVESAVLRALHQAINDSTDIPTNPQSFDFYAPHMTIAYVRPDRAQEFVGLKNAKGQQIRVESFVVTDRDGKQVEIELGGKDSLRMAREPSKIGRSDESVLDYMERVQRGIADREALAAKLAATGEPVTLTHPDGRRTALVGRDVSSPGKFRSTRFDDQGPIGHTTFNTREDALNDIMREGFVPKETAPEDRVTRLVPSTLADHDLVVQGDKVLDVIPKPKRKEPKGWSEIEAEVEAPPLPDLLKAGQSHRLVVSKTQGDAPIIYVNHQTADTLQSLENGKVSGWGGLSMAAEPMGQAHQMAMKLADLADTLPAAQAHRARSLADTLIAANDAALKSGGSITVIKTERRRADGTLEQRSTAHVLAIQAHEQHHAVQRQLSRAFSGGRTTNEYIDPDFIDSVPGLEPVLKRLGESGVYEGYHKASLTMEVFTHLSTSPVVDVLGVNRKQATELLRHFYDAVYDRHGRAGVEAFVNINQEAQGVRDEILTGKDTGKSERADARERQRAGRSVSEGEGRGDGGVREDGRGDGGQAEAKNVADPRVRKAQIKANIAELEAKADAAREAYHAYRGDPDEVNRLLHESQRAWVAVEKAREAAGKDQPIWTPEDNENLKAFLEPSSVKDTVFHGGPKIEGDVFNTPTFFAANRKDADWYTAEKGDGKKKSGEYYVQIKNPLDISTRDGAISFVKLAEKAGVEVNLKEGTHEWEFYAPEVSKHSPYDGENVFDLVYIPKVREALKAAGYDGLKGLDTLENSEVPIYVALEPTQIKSATKNEGTFDPNDPNMLHAAEEPDKPLDPAAAKAKYFGAGARKTAEPRKTEAHGKEATKFGTRPTGTTSKERIAPAGLPGGTVKPLNRIIEDFATSIERVIAKTKQARNYLGTYWPRDTHVGIRYAGDLDTVAHEAAHALDDQHGIVAEWAYDEAGSPFDDELIPHFSRHGSRAPGGMDEVEALAYTRAEGVAEWMRAYVVNPDAAKAAAPEFARWFEMKVPPDTKAAIAAYSKDVRQFVGMDADMQVRAGHRLETPQIGWVEKKLGLRKGHVREDLARELSDQLKPAIDRWKEVMEFGGQDPTKVAPRNNFETLLRRLAGHDEKMEDIFENGLPDMKNPLEIDDKGRVVKVNRLLEGGIKRVMRHATRGRESLAAAASLMSSERQIYRTDLEGEKATKAAQKLTEKFYQKGLAVVEKEAKVRERAVEADYNKRLKDIAKSRDKDIAKAKDEKAKQKAIDLAHRRTDDAVKRYEKDRSNHSEWLDKQKDDLLQRVEQFHLKAEKRGQERAWNRAGNFAPWGAGLDHPTNTARAAIEALKRRDPALYEEAKAIASDARDHFDAVLQYLEDMGRYSPEEVERFRKERDYYTPFKRVLDPDWVEDTRATHGGGVHVTSRSDVVKRFKGGRDQIENPFISMLDNAYRAVKEADGNAVMNAFVEPMRLDRSMYQGPTINLAQFGFKGAKGDKDAVRIFHPMTDKEGKRIVEEEYWVFPKDTLESLKGIGEVGDLGWGWTWLTAPGRLQRWGVVRGLGFMIRNPLRDPFQRVLMSNVGSEFYRSFTRFSAEEKAAFRQGGGQAGHFETAPADYDKMIDLTLAKLSTDKKTIAMRAHDLWTAPERIGRFLEEQGRLAEFQKAIEVATKKYGMDSTDALIFATGEARGLLDYAIAGRTVKRISQIIPFTNPQVQGLKKTGELLKKAWNDPHKRKVLIAKVAYTSILPEIAAYIFNAAQGDDVEKKYWQQPAYLRDTFWNFHLGDDFWLRIPKPFELGIPASFVGRFISKFRGDPHAFEGHGGQILKMIAPVDPEVMATGGLGGVGQAIMNRDLFRNQYIVDPNEEKMHVELRKGTKNASNLGQILQKATGDNIDARTIDFLLRSQLGGVGTQAAQLSDVGEEGGSRRLGMTSAGIFTGSPGTAARDVQFVLKEAEARNESNSDVVEELREIKRAYNEAGTAADRERLSTALIDAATKARTLFDSTGSFLTEKEGKARTRNTKKRVKRDARDREDLLEDYGILNEDE